ncbi:MAG: hypothetical protein LBK40_01535 [Spirochaetaceae bacterium]|jgi:hypothetical protein|nr:hypothetical protein [Spirochaetaceae bacterium]
MTRALALPVLALAGSFGLFGAEITVPRLEAFTRGAKNGDDFVLSSVAEADLAVEGGYKYSAYLGFSFSSGDLERLMARGNLNIDHLTAAPTDSEFNDLVDELEDRLNRRTTLGLRVIKATAREPLGLPLELSYFLGKADTFASGDDFVNYFGTAPLSSDFRGFMYFPDGIGGDITNQYHGIHQVNGTGLSLALTRSEKVIPMGYFYQDLGFTDAGGNFEAGHYSGDLRLLVNSRPLRLEFFGGLSFHRGGENIYRGGLLAHLAAEAGAELFIQAGVPGWRQGEDFDMDHLFFLLEPRIRFGFFAVRTTFFYRPLWYLQRENKTEQGKADINVKLIFGNLDESQFEFGLEGTGGLQTAGMDDRYFYVSPFLSMVSSGLRWDTKLRIDPFEYDNIGEMFELFMGIRTAY